MNNFLRSNETSLTPSPSPVPIVVLPKGRRIKNKLRGFYTANSRIKQNIINQGKEIKIGHWTLSPITRNKPNNPYVIVGDPMASVYNKNDLLRFGSNPLDPNQRIVEIAPLPYDLRLLGGWHKRKRNNN